MTDVATVLLIQRARSHPSKKETFSLLNILHGKEMHATSSRTYYPTTEIRCKELCIFPQFTFFKVYHIENHWDASTNLFQVNAESIA